MSSACLLYTSIQAHKDDLGVEGAFTSAGFDASSDWRFKTHLANLPVYYEYKADGITSTDAIKGTYLDNYKQIFDLYITDATCEPSLLSGKTGEDAASEFALGEAVFYQNGTWAYNDIKDNEVADEDLGMLPISVSYTHLDVYKRQLHLYELADGASCTCRMVDVKGADVCAITAERKGGVYSFKADGDMKGLTVILHGICAEGVKAENAQIHTDSVSGCVSAAIGTSTREVKITVE